jgi:hypothetical protein
MWKVMWGHPGDQVSRDRNGNTGSVGKYVSGDWIQLSFINVHCHGVNFYRLWLIFIGYHRDDKPTAIQNTYFVKNRYWIRQYLCIKKLLGGNSPQWAEPA